jgi:hypothetical protein|tara:strand:- start:71 stop:589 length:519 start_codon:yes stop_codon:yes gene_type:complete
VVYNYEEPKFETISKFSGFEIRKYFDSVQAIVETNGRDWQSSTVGFRKIAGYIFGRNNRDQKIAMTSPVIFWNDNEKSMMAFIMPSEYSMSDLPHPNDEGIKLRKIQGKKFAVLSFSGLSGIKKTKRMIKKLQLLIQDENLSSTGPTLLAVYDNPTSTLPFLRRNEILIPIN